MNRSRNGRARMSEAAAVLAPAMGLGPGLAAPGAGQRIGLETGAVTYRQDIADGQWRYLSHRTVHGPLYED